MAKYLDPKADLISIHISKELLENANVSKAVKLVEESAYTEAELLAIDHYWDAVSRERTALSEKYDKGLEDGIAIGEERGEERGIAIGEERGIAIGEERERKKAYEEKLANARSLKALGILTPQQIADALGLTVEDVEFSS